MVSPGDADPSEQSGRFQKEHERDDREDDRERDILKEDLPEGVGGAAQAGAVNVSPIPNPAPIGRNPSK